jgi:hypothetical protein
MVAVLAGIFAMPRCYMAISDHSACLYLARFRERYSSWLMRTSQADGKWLDEYRVPLRRMAEYETKRARELENSYRYSPLEEERRDELSTYGNSAHRALVAKLKAEARKRGYKLPRY